MARYLSRAELSCIAGKYIEMYYALFGIITSTRNAPASFTPARAFLVLFKNIGKGKQLYFSAFLCLK